MSENTSDANEEHRDPDDELEKYKLVGPDERIPQDRHWWRREGIYLSDVCLAVHLSPTFTDLKRDEEEPARHALYSYMRRIGQTALERDYLVPLVCVLDLSHRALSPVAISALKSWAPDQEWHRGAFTLYVEIPETWKADSNQPKCPCGPPSDWDHRRRLADLLSPKPEELVLPPIDPVDQKSIILKLQERLQESPPAQGGIKSADELLGLFDKELDFIKRCLESDSGNDREKCLDSHESPLLDWADRVARNAQEEAMGLNR